MVRPVQAGSNDSENGEPPVHDTDYCDLADFRYALRLFLRYSEEQARGAGITPQQHLLLLAVRGHASYPNVTIGEVAERLQVRHHSASRLVERGVQRGLLERREDADDRRKALVSLTPAGLQVLYDITRANKRELRSLEGALFRDSLRLALHAYNSTQQN
jgi:DNA-binding MarR family transcriptional regulator